MKTKAYFAFRIDVWDSAGNSLTEHLARPELHFPAPVKVLNRKYRRAEELLAFMRASTVAHASVSGTSSAHTAVNNDVG